MKCDTIFFILIVLLLIGIIGVAIYDKYFTIIPRCDCDTEGKQMVAYHFNLEQAVWRAKIPAGSEIISFKMIYVTHPKGIIQHKDLNFICEFLEENAATEEK